MAAEPMDDDTLIALAQQRYDDAGREEATHEDCRQLRDIFPAVLQRLREKVEITSRLVRIPYLDLNDPIAVARVMAEHDNAELDRLCL